MILLDTTVIIDIGRDRIGAKKCIEKYKNKSLIISAMTVLELSGETKGKSKAKEIMIDVQNLIIGATTESLKVEKILTRNEDHFKNFNVPIESYKFK